MSLLQESAYAGEDYQVWRKAMANICHAQVAALNPALISVKLNLQYVEKYKQDTAFDAISEGDKADLMKQIAPMVHFDDPDELAKRFDNFMYSLMLAVMEQQPTFRKMKKDLCDIATELEKRITIPQVKEKLPLIQTINTDAFWTANNVLSLENARKELRGLIQFLDVKEPNHPIITSLQDIFQRVREGDLLDPAYDFEDYRQKVNRYIGEHGDTLAIYKLTHNIKLMQGDYEELERVLTTELGSKADYQREFGDTPFGLLVRQIAKMDHEAAMQAFSAFINDQSLNQRQIAFVNKIINHIEQNGYMDDVTDLQKPPFDKPVAFIKLFDAKTRTELMNTIKAVKENAVSVAQ